MAPGGPGDAHNGWRRVTEVGTWLLKMQHQGLAGQAALIGPFDTQRPGRSLSDVSRGGNEVEAGLL